LEKQGVNKVTEKLFSNTEENFWKENRNRQSRKKGGLGSGTKKDRNVQKFSPEHPDTWGKRTEKGSRKMWLPTVNRIQRGAEFV